MTKGIKIFITVVFVILALLSGMMSFMIVGMGVSGSGCGQECFDNMDSAKFISIIFWILAIISGIFAFMDNGSPKKKSSVTRLRKVRISRSFLPKLTR